MTEDRGGWRDRMVGDRMAVDRQFADRVAGSDFSSQEWGLIMTATEFRIENPESEDARLVADTSKVASIVDDLDEIRETAGPMGPAGPGGPQSDGRRDSGGFLSSVKEAIGLGGDGTSGRDPEQIRRKADALTDEYADLLQERLENEGKWGDLRAMAAREQSTAGGDTEREERDGDRTESADADDGDAGDAGGTPDEGN